MANAEHLDLLRQGVEVWNAWREAHPGTATDLSRVDLSMADLAGGNFTKTDLTGANLLWAILCGTSLVEANLTGANFIGANLTGTDFQGAHLTKADFGGANLTKANFVWVDLSRVDLTGADLTGADLTGADLGGANLTGANLTGTNLVQANLGGANLTDANLHGANLIRVQLIGTIFGATCLENVKGLENCIHKGPSTVDYRTLEKSGPLPLAFLRGCGLPDILIDYLPSLLNQPIQYYSCFISYSSKDEVFTRRLHADLQNNGVRCWFAPEDMKIGDKIRSRIDESIRVHDKLLLVLSQDSVDSEWVEKEVESAFEQERKRKQTVLFPIRLDDAVIGVETGWAADIRLTRHIGDFCSWKSHDDYQAAFNRLLRDLKPELEKKPDE